ncbi:pelargonidin 3-O-(6-caffeoylglucoside) 5-O-(6-O-malonylglucoside) 4'''-malonyltransferase-like [Salvia miltiorrhiza]|uniref:pelargonidin 3-O-(6-caffeoylglucoside) 5-O-(6-O-malonylglucoside) 4'''-malonyltransferase-like n=1 Tax=Salvia miltiorrhiza TaxID=226208 RepID=UPI0025AC68A5|nr:pelargonidin 3-O-(6-caffeoylglucoside) 5-O-(6-O-malonylglucoside) 4'''-malonyltransferase-like [Salvia miltiorrhiza]
MSVAYEFGCSSVLSIETGIRHWPKPWWISTRLLEDTSRMRTVSTATMRAEALDVELVDLIGKSHPRHRRQRFAQDFRHTFHHHLHFQINWFKSPRLSALRLYSPAKITKASSADGPKIVAKRLLFDKAALTTLKSKIRPETTSGSQVVSAVIAKALIGVDRAKHGKSRDFVVFQPINMRERTIPPQSKHICANLTFTTLTPEEMGVQELVDVIGDGVRNTVAELAGVLSPYRDGREIIMKSLGSMMKAFQNQETKFIAFSDCSEFGFYEADFGWGKPAWATLIPQRLRSNSSVLMSNKEGDGIEAWVHLYQDDMPYFDQDECSDPLFICYLNTVSRY